MANLPLDLDEYLQGSKLMAWIHQMSAEQNWDGRPHSSAMPTLPEYWLTAC